MSSMVATQVPIPIALSRYDGIQFLRFVASALVVLTHATFYTHERLDGSFPVWRFGTIGVDIFFVISGFVMMISSQSLIGRSDGWKEFTARRLLRIVPMYWLATTVKLGILLLVPAMVLHSELDPVRILLSYLFFPTTNVDGRFEPLLGVGWTLIFEMFFYFCFALALRLRLDVLPFVASVMIACTVVSLFRQDEWPAATMYFDPIVLYFLLGMVLAVLPRQHGRGAFLVAGSVFLVLSACLMLGDVAGAFQERGWLRMGLVVTSVYLVILAEPMLQGRIPRAFLYLGEISYVLYLFHPLVAPAVPEVLERLKLESVALSVVGCVCAAVAFAALVHTMVEAPLASWLKRKVPHAGSRSNRGGAMAVGASRLDGALQPCDR